MPETFSVTVAVAVVVVGELGGVGTVGAASSTGSDAFVDIWIPSMGMVLKGNLDRG